MGQNIIELNGKRYDALTGAFLGKSDKPAVAAAPSSGRVIDGFIRPAPHAPAAAAKPAAPAASKSEAPSLKKVKDSMLARPVAKPVAKTVKAPADDVVPEPPAAPTAKLHHAGHQHLHKPAHQVRPHQPQHAQTLMRRSVHKPATKLKPAIKPQSPAEIAPKPASSLVHKPSAASVDPVRLSRAQHTPRHGAVQHFQPSAQHAGLTPAAAPAQRKEVPLIIVKPTPEAQHVSRASQHAARPTTDIFERAIAQATSHEQPAYKPRKTRAHRRLVNTLAAVAAFLVIGGFVAYLNLPNIELHVASVQAGFRATMPSYAPTGYALRGGVQHHGGTVALRFTSGDSSYTITQQASDWNSQTLLDNTLALSGPHDTVQKNGQIIYIYSSGNSTNAAWVNGSVRYDISGSANLTPDDIGNIAASM